MKMLAHLLIIIGIFSSSAKAAFIWYEGCSTFEISEEGKEIYKGDVIWPKETHTFLQKLPHVNSTRYDENRQEIIHRDTHVIYFTPAEVATLSEKCLTKLQNQQELNRQIISIFIQENHGTTIHIHVKIDGETINASTHDGFRKVMAYHKGFKPHSMVTLRGLRLKPELNGRSGQIIAAPTINEKGELRFPVKLSGDDAQNTLLLKEENLSL